MSSSSYYSSLFRNRGVLGDQKIELDNCADYVKSLDTFVFFVENVDCKKTSSISLLSRREDSEISYCIKGLEKAIESFKVKAIKPIRTLCLRMLKEGRGFTRIHMMFLANVINFSLHKLAKEIIETKALPEM